MNENDSGDIQFLEKKNFVYIYGKKIPHWHQESKTIFATFRLADSLPQDKLEELKAMKLHESANQTNGKDYTNHKKQALETARKIEKWIDAGHGSCMLADKELREIVVQSIRFFDGNRYALHAFVVMPNHVHLLLSPLGNIPVVQTLGKVKSYTGKLINKRLNRMGDVWQHGTFDRMVRDAGDFARYLSYICNNPKQLAPDSYTLYVRR